MVQNISNYTFVASTKEITLTGVTINLEKVRLIKNLTTNTFIYKFTDALSISAVGSVITFTADNTGMTNTDKLLIQYDLDTSVDIQKISADVLENSLNSIIKEEDTLHTSGDKGIMLLGLRSDNDTATANEGDYTTLKLDEQGRLKVSTKPASYPDITGSITTTQPVISTPVVGGTVSGDVSRASNVMLFCTGTFSTINCTFEGSLEATGDTNWFTIQAIRSNANTVETATGNLSAQPAYAWELSVNALSRIRVRATARTSGTQNWLFKLGTYATEPIPAAQVSATQPVSGTVTANQGTLVTPTASIVNSAATTNATVVKGSAGTLYSIVVSSTRVTTCYLKFHNSTTVTAGATAVVLTIAVPTNSTVTVPFGATGMRFGTGICLSITSLAADNDTTSIGASEVKVLTSYI